MMKKLMFGLSLLVIVLLVGCGTGEAISKGGPISIDNYQSLFVKSSGLTRSSTFNGIMVVGVTSTSASNMAITDIATSFKNTIFPQDSLQLDSDIFDYTLSNIIAVGSPCDNTVIAHLEDSPVNCKMNLGQGRAFIKLKFINNHYYLLVEGLSDKDMKVASKVLVYRTSELKGTEIFITYTDEWTNAIIKIIK